MDRTIQSGLSTGTVGQKSSRLPRIGSSFRCTHHVVDLEILNGDEVVVVHELSAQFVRCIASLILDLVMESHDLINLASTTVRSALFGREMTLSSSEILLCICAEVLAFPHFTVTGGDLVHDAEIDANLAAGRFQRHRGHLQATHAEPPLGSFALHGDGLRIAY